MYYMQLSFIFDDLHVYISYILQEYLRILQICCINLFQKLLLRKQINEATPRNDPLKNEKHKVSSPQLYLLYEISRAFSLSVKIKHKCPNFQPRFGSGYFISLWKVRYKVTQKWMMLHVVEGSGIQVGL